MFIAFGCFAAHKQKEKPEKNKLISMQKKNKLLTGLVGRKKISQKNSQSTTTTSMNVLPFCACVHI